MMGLERDNRLILQMAFIAKVHIKGWTDQLQESLFATGMNMTPFKAAHYFQERIPLHFVMNGMYWIPSAALLT